MIFVSFTQKRLQSEMIDEFVNCGFNSTSAFFQKTTSLFKDEKDKQKHVWMASKEQKWINRWPNGLNFKMD